MERIYDIAAKVIGKDHAADFTIWFGKYFPNYDAPDGVVIKYTKYFISRVIRKKVNDALAEYEYARIMPTATGPPSEIIDLQEDLRCMGIKDIQREWKLSQRKARELKRSMKYEAKLKSVSSKVFKFRDGEHEVLFVEFDFDVQRVPTSIWKIKDTYAQFSVYKKLFTNLDAGTKFYVRFGSEKGRQAGRIVWAQPAKKNKDKCEAHETQENES